MYCVKNINFSNENPMFRGINNYVKNINTQKLFTKNKEKAICPCCSEEFIFYKKNPRIYCSRYCYNKVHPRTSKLKLPRIKKICDHCNKEFIVIETSKKRFCSRKCCDKGLIRRVPKVKKVVKHCPQCSAEFIVYPSLDVRKYCSKKCKHVGMKKEGTELRAQQWRETIGKELARIWKRKNKNRINQQVNARRAKNKEFINKKFKEKRKYDIKYRLECILRGRLACALRAVKCKKSFPTLNLLGCEIDYLKQYIESLWLEGMNWDNHGLLGWHIDHIKPINTFDLTDPEQQKQCFHYTNLRPLWYQDNLKRPKDGSDVAKPIHCERNF